jgi:hypothetical protein
LYENNKPEMLRCQISSDIQDLNELHTYYNWIPDENMIRPSPIVLENKREASNYILHTWMSFRDFILDTHFKYPVDIEDGHIYVRDEVTKSEWNFSQSVFPYDVPANVNHYILWNSLYTYDANMDDDLINELIKETIENMIGSDEFDFAWYKNPKPSIPELWHCQVFWIRV